MTAKFSWEIVARVFVGHATDGKIEEAVYDKFVEDLRTKDYGVYLATTSGSAELSSVQRKAASDALAERKIPTFVVSDSRMVRGIVTAASWLGVNVKSFSWANILEAFAETQELLLLTDEEIIDVKEALRKICKSHGVSEMDAVSSG
jgi:hypothetical protein